MSVMTLVFTCNTLGRVMYAYYNCIYSSGGLVNTGGEEIQG